MPKNLTKVAIFPFTSFILVSEPSSRLLWHLIPKVVLKIVMSFMSYHTSRVCSNDGFTTKNSEILLGMTHVDPKLTVIVDGVRPDHLNARMILVTSPPLPVTKASPIDFLKNRSHRPGQFWSTS